MNEVAKALLEFDRQRNWNDYEKAVTETEKLEVLNKQIVNLLGEFGEFANEVKKCRRDKVWKEKELKEELADMYIFLLKMVFTLNMNLETETLQKIKINETRFKHFIK